MAVEKLKPFEIIKYTTSQGENCTATKKDGIVTIQGDKNGIRQMPLDKFMNDFINDQSKKTLERQPDSDKVSFSGGSKNLQSSNNSYEKNLKKEIRKGNILGWLGVGGCAFSLWGLFKNPKWLNPSILLGTMILSPIIALFGALKVDDAQNTLNIYEAVSNGVK